MKEIKPFKPPVNPHGFTLIEVLIALTIFALVSVVCYKQISSTTVAMERLELKYFALWVAENSIDEVFLERKWPSLGESETQYVHDNKKWTIITTVSETNNINLRKIEVKVIPESKSSDNSVISLVRFIGKY